MIKVLGYVYVWNGQPEKATFLLKEIPEADKEMRQYAIWWKKQGRQDLALKASRFVRLGLPRYGACYAALAKELEPFSSTVPKPGFSIRKV